MDANDVIANQFNRGANRFERWSVTRDDSMLRGLGEFCCLSENDDVLDIACGTGAFALHAAPRVRSVTGVDIAAGMIDVAERTAGARGHVNTEFHCRDVERSMLPRNHYSVVVSRSAFHHMPRYREVFAEMVRCCRPGGTICIQDVMAYDDAATNAFFEQLELLVDESHHRTYTKRELFDLYKSNGVKLDGLLESVTELDLHDYVDHVAAPTAELRKSVDALVEAALRDTHIASWFVERNNRMFWRRRVCTIKGRKGETGNSRRCKWWSWNG